MSVVSNLRRRPLKVAVVLPAAECCGWVARLESLGHRAAALDERLTPSALCDPELDVVIGRIDPNLRSLRELVRVPALIHVGTLRAELVDAIGNNARLVAAADLDEACLRLEELAPPERHQPRFR